ncbi:hypothetical protein H2201_004497 [Coniosporium apollinis]|uniref:Apple domain-containing protein n=1 Tax=Coniosporium apollinis TaxID=61459 RepID=A0ABQ9NVX0_9PEZI|nr:hypothetical protein H2201_004497 [Coniosporium apollinis]
MAPSSPRLSTVPPHGGQTFTPVLCYLEASSGDINLTDLSTIASGGDGAPVGTATSGVPVNYASISSAVLAQVGDFTTTNLADYVTVPTSPPTSIPRISAAVNKENPAYPPGVLPKTRGPAPLLGKRQAYYKDTRNQPTLKGYTSAFAGLQGATQAKGYLTYETLKTYDPAACATFCNSVKMCQFFNIYYERNKDAAGNPIDIIKCSAYSLFQTSATATNKGQWRGTFQILITGSNGYNKATNSQAPPGYTLEDFGNAAINAPLYDRTGQSTFIQPIYLDQYDPALCAAACDSQTDYNKRHSEDGCNFKACVFANLYILSENGVPKTTVCALYTQGWGSTHAVNSGYSTSTDVYLVSNSIGLTNTIAATMYPQTCSICEPKNAELIPKTLGSTDLATWADWSAVEIDGTFTYHSTYGRCAVGSTVYVSYDKAPTDIFVYYAVPNSNTVGCASTGYIYHVDSGLCLTQSKTSESAPMYVRRTTTLQPCDISDTAPPMSQKYCHNSLILTTYYPDQCYTFYGDGAFDLDYEWYGLGPGYKEGAYLDISPNTYVSRPGGVGCMWMRIDGRQK